MLDITPIVLCGGAGTRLWPLSRRALPKQFAPLVSDESLFVSGLRRLASIGLLPPIIVTGESHRFLVRDQLTGAHVEHSTVLVEPDARNTAPAILAAALVAKERDPQALLLAAPSDHLIADDQAFARAIERGNESAREGAIVTFGVPATRPETGYGYLKLAEPIDGPGPVDLSVFIEKPDAETASTMVADGRFLWNAGIFLFRADVLLEAFAVHQPSMLDGVRAAVNGRTSDLGFERLDPDAWREVESISIDYAIMEKAQRLTAVPYAGGWCDLGDWAAVWRESPADAEGVVAVGDVLALDCTDSYLRSTSQDVVVAGLDLTDTVVVATQDAVLVANKAHAQNVKHIVEGLERRGKTQATTFPRDHRPWGYFDVLAQADRFQVKRLVVNPGASLSLQSHMHRAEHWIVVSGTARVTIEGETSLASENEAIYVPLGAQHRLENPGKVPMELIEVQSGSYLGEDDIVRHDDPHQRA